MRQVTDVRSHCPLLVSYYAKFCKVTDHNVGAVLAEDLRVVAQAYADDEAEAARPTEVYSGDDVLY
jgi:deoxycytidylate deaminase